MQFKITPLLIISAGLVLFGLYYFFSGEGGNLGPLTGIVAVEAGLLCLLIYFILRKVLRNKIKAQVIAELSLVIIIAFFYFRSSESVVLHVPPGFRGYVMLISNVDKKPALQSPAFFSRDIDVTVPASGIIFTSSPGHKKIIVVDGSRGGVKTLRPGYEIPFAWDTLYCNYNNYPVDLVLVGNLPPGWNLRRDTVRRNVKKEIACRLLSE